MPEHGRARLQRSATPGDCAADRRTLDRRPPAPHPRRNPPEGRSRESRARRGSLPRRHRRRARQGARSFGLRAALKLAKLHQSTARPVEAHDILAPALEGFSPTPEFQEIEEAQTLLAALEETGEVKADSAQRQRMAHLRVASATRSLLRVAMGPRKRQRRSPELENRRQATRTRGGGWRPTTAYGSAASREATCHQCGRTWRTSSATLAPDPIYPKPASRIAPPE